MAGVSCEKEIICNFYQGCFSAVIVAKTGLKWFIEVIVLKVDLKLCRYCPFQKFSDEWEVGDGAVVIWIVWIRTCFFFRIGVTEAVLRDVETVAVDREELIMDVMMGEIEGRQDLTRTVGMGSSKQEESLDLVMSLVISSTVGSWKVDRVESGESR